MAKVLMAISIKIQWVDQRRIFDEAGKKNKINHHNNNNEPIWLRATF